MTYWRQKKFGKLSHSNETIYFNTEQMQKFCTTDDSQLMVQFDNQLPDNRIVIITIDNMLRWLGDADRMHCDGTFFTAPKFFTQLYIIQGYNSVLKRMLPGAFVLLNSKSETTYDQVF